MIKASHILADAIINHPTVRPTAQGGTERLSSRGLFANGACAYADERGAMVLFVPQGDDVWEGHVFAVAGSRGANALRLGRQALGRLFTDHRAQKLVSAVPMQLPAARMYCRRLGLRSVRCDELVEHFAMEKEQWAAS